MTLRYHLFAMTAVLGAIVSAPTVAQNAAGERAIAARLPIISCWYQGRPVLYLATDASDKALAKFYGANYVPQLANAITSHPKSVDDIYTITNFAQDNILPSAPQPVGPNNTNKSYTPLWQLSKVTWVAGATRRILRSEREVLDAVEDKEVTIAKTNIVINCTVIHTASGTLPNTVIIYN